MKTIIKKFSDITLKDIRWVGGKNASLGEMYNSLKPQGIQVPDGFAVTADAFYQFLDHYQVKQELDDIMNRLDTKNFSNLNDVGQAARNVIGRLEMPDFLSYKIKKAYKQLVDGKMDTPVAIRSSATAEDLPDASFAGQLDSFLNVRGPEEVVATVKKCFASLYTDRVINYRHQKGFNNIDVAISVGIQLMVRSDVGASGVAFTLDPESGNDKVIIINSIYGLGENIVQGRSTPDEFIVFKQHLDSSFNPVISKKLGRKEWTMVYGEGEERLKNNETPNEKREQFSLETADVVQLAEWCSLIEKHYGKPMDIEWAKDGLDGTLYITQARPETIHANKKDSHISHTYKVLQKGKLLAQGIAVGERIISGKARLMTSVEEAAQLQQDEILVTDITSPDWDPVLKKVAGVVTNKGGRTSHAAIVARELGAVAVVGCGDATSNIKTGDLVTLNCVEGTTGFVYEGKAKWTTQTIEIGNMVMPATDAMLILGDPSQAYKLSQLPNKGVGLARMEFMITHHIKVHPLALTRFHLLKDEKVKAEIDELTKGYSEKGEYFVDRLAEGIVTIASAFYPNDVIVRMSDFKSNEYASLLGGAQFEPEEENPMLGFRGASRYYSPMYKDGFALECKAIQKVRDEMGFTNVKVMIPFCRTVEEARQVIDTMEEMGLKQKNNGLEIYVMIEIPSNVLMAKELASIFDGFSIGSNDLTQLTLGIDRDSSLVSHHFNEMNPAVLQLIANTIHTARNNNIKVGLCGQAPSDIPEFANFLVEQGINSISFNSDALLKGIKNIALAEGLDITGGGGKKKPSPQQKIDYKRQPLITN